MEGIQSVTSGANVFDTSEAKFGDNPFLEILMAQMRTQTPLEPVDNSSFMTQMSQLSNMEQQQELNDNMLNLLQFQGALARLNGLTQGASMIGREVEYVIDESGGTAKGTVESLQINEEGEVVLQIDGKNVALATVVGMRGEASGSDSNDSSKNES